MDTSKEHIEMCEKATEIQRIHNQHPYDCQYDKDQDRIFVVSSLSDAALNEPCYPMEIWLPYPYQLQEMSGLDWVTFDSMCVELATAHRWDMEIKRDDGSVDYKTAYKHSKESAGLEVVMRERFGKIWDGEGWSKAFN